MSTRLSVSIDPMGRRHWHGDRFSAAVCRRGHVITPQIELQNEDPPDHCPTCGGRVLTACPACQDRILGGHVAVAALYSHAPDFCGCGAPFPWASEQAVIYHLENQLEEEPDLSESDRRELEAQLRVLTNRDEKAKRRADAYSFIQRTVPRVWAIAEPAMRVFLTSEMQQHLPR